MESRSSVKRKTEQNFVSQSNTVGKFIQQKLSKEYPQIPGMQELSLGNDLSSQFTRQSQFTDPTNKDGNRVLDFLGQNITKKVQTEAQKQKQIQSELKAVKEERKQKLISIYASENTAKTTITSKIASTKQGKQGTKISSKLPATKGKGVGIKNQVQQQQTETEQALDFLNEDVYSSEAHFKEATISITKLYGYQGASANINKNTNKLNIIQEELKKQDSDDDFEDFKTEMPEVNKMSQFQSKYVTTYQNNNEAQQNQNTTPTQALSQVGTQLEEVLFLDQLNNGKMLKSYVIKRTKQIVVGSLIWKFLPHFVMKNEDIYKLAVSKQTINYVTDLQSSYYNFSNEEDLEEFLSSNIPKYCDLAYLKVLAIGGEAIVYGGKTGHDQGLVVKCTIFDSQSSSQSDVHQAFLHILEETQQIILLNSLSQQLVGNSQMFPKILDEIVLINEQTKMIKQYVVIIERAECTLHDILITWQDKAKQIENNERYHPLKLVYFFIKTLQLVKFLHSINLYYGDMKPQNLLIFSDYSIKIGDFGISIMQDPNTKSLDKVHTLKGLTTAYCSAKTLNAFKQRRKFSMKELKKLDKESLALTFEKCIRTIQEVHQKEYPNIPIDILQKFVTDLTKGKSLKVIIANQIQLQNQNQKVIKDFRLLIKRENNSQRLKELDQMFVVKKKNDAVETLNRYFEEVVTMFSKEKNIIALKVVKQDSWNYSYNLVIDNLYKAIEQIEIEPENKHQQYKKDYLLALTKVYQQIYPDGPKYQNPVLDTAEKSVQQPSLTFAPQVNIQILNALSLEFLNKYTKDSLDKNTLQRID
eukprot:403357708